MNFVTLADSRITQLPNLNVFIDGSWLFNACRAGRSLSASTEESSGNFSIDFDRFNDSLLRYVKEQSAVQDLTLGDLFMVTSIFEIPAGSEDWPINYSEHCTTEGLERVKNGAGARERFVAKALVAKYRDETVFRPKLKPYIVASLGEGRYQEKQVDATVVALVVKYAITKPLDFHIIVSGDKDMLPAVQVACPEFTKNVSVATTHPDGMSSEQRQSAFSLFSYEFTIPPFILEDHSEKIIAGAKAYKCRECGKTFVRAKPVPRTARPTCSPCSKQKQPFKA
jgi:NYN domain